jgi:hypothetical protein
MRSAEYTAGQQAKRSGLTQDDNPYLAAPNKVGIRRPTNEQAAADWAVGFRDETAAIYERKHGPVPELRNFVRRVRCSGRDR